MNRPQPRIACSHTVEDVACGVGRAVVGDDDFKLWVILIEYRLQRLFDVARFVTRGDDYRNAGPLGLRKRRDVFERTDAMGAAPQINRDDDVNRKRGDGETE